MIRAFIEDRFSPRLGHPDRDVGTPTSLGVITVMIHDRVGDKLEHGTAFGALPRFGSGNLGRRL